MRNLYEEAWRELEKSNKVSTLSEKTWGLILDEEENTGKKFDMGKPLWNTLPIKEVEQIVNVLTMGAKKYGLDNWKIVPNAKDRYENAMMRHYSAWKQGELIDEESGESHLAHLACNALFLMWMENEAKKNVVLEYPLIRTEMKVCKICGNKRCPRANDLRYACNDSNEPHQIAIPVEIAYRDMLNRHNLEYSETNVRTEEHQKEEKEFKEKYGWK